MTTPNRVLLVLDALLIAAAAGIGSQLYRAWRGEPAGPALLSATPGPSTPVRTSGVRATRPSNGMNATEAVPLPAPDGFAVVAERSLFSPTRTEAGPQGSKLDRPATPSPAAPKPFLYGVVLGAAGGPRAYLEDPRIKKVAAIRSVTLSQTAASRRFGRTG